MLINRYNIIQSFINNEQEKKIYFNNKDLGFTKKEYAIFDYLYYSQERFSTRKEMLVNVLGYHEDSTTRLVDVYIKHIRKKIEQCPASIQTVRKEGYRLVIE